MSVCVYSPFAYILAQAMVGFEQFVLKKYSCWFGLTKGKNIVTNICKNICSFSAFFHWHFPTGSVANQPSKPMCHRASGERKQTLSNVDQKTPIHFDASLAVCLVLSRLESQTHLTLLATRAKQSQTLPPAWARKPVLTLGFGESCSWSTAGTTANKKTSGFLSPCTLTMTQEQCDLPGDCWSCLLGRETPVILLGCAILWCAPRHSSSEAATASLLLHNSSTAETGTVFRATKPAQGTAEKPSWGWLEIFSSEGEEATGYAEGSIFS